MKLVQRLQTEIEAWLARSKVNNLSILATKTKLPHATVYRISKGQIKLPQVETTLSLLRITSTREDRIAVVREFFPGLAELLEGDRA